MIKIYRVQNGWMVRSPLYREVRPTELEQCGEQETYYRFLEEVIDFLKGFFHGYYEDEKKEMRLLAQERELIKKELRIEIEEERLAAKGIEP